MPRIVEKESEPCVYCKKRLTRRASGMCEPCELLTKAEGTYEQFAHKTFNDIHAEARKKNVSRYNRLVRKGFTYQQILEAFGWTYDQMTQYMSKARIRYNMQVLDIRKYTAERMAVIRAAQPPKPADRPRNAHGGGRWGIARCKCELCVARCKQTRKELDDARQQQRKGLPS